MPEFETVLYEKLAGNLCRITMNRPEVRNAQNRQLTYDLNDAFYAAAHDNDVKVIILAGAGPHFSAGHDLSGKDRDKHYDPFFLYHSEGRQGAEARMSAEEEIYLEMCRRWRDLPKPTIAQVHGKCIAGGLMLAWVCDIIVCSDDAQFSDPVVRMGVCGVEYFAHPWELGARMAKEFLFTGDFLSAQDAYRLGMVNHVYPREKLEEETLALARRIALMPSSALMWTKMAVNQTLECMGQRNAMNAVFNLHHIAHSHNAEVTGGSPVLGGNLAGGVREYVRQRDAGFGSNQET
jgi:enoyl-CoA hydratase